MKQFQSLGRIKSPCYGCQNRSAGCHSGCDEYQKYLDEHNAEVEQIRENRKKQNAGFRPRMTDREFQNAIKQGKNKVLKQHKR